MKLYYHPLSGHCHRVRLFLSFIGIDVQLVEVNLPKGAHKRIEFLALNRFGQVPVLDDGGVILADANAILIYLAKKFGRTDWLPDDALGSALVQRWLSVAAGQIAFGPAAARQINLFGAEFNADEVIGRAHSAFRIVEIELATRDWIATTRPTIADIALYSYIARAPEGNVDISGYPYIRAWLDRIEKIPGFIGFQKTQVGLSETDFHGREHKLLLTRSKFSYI